MKYEKPIIEIVLLQEDDAVLTSRITDVNEWDPNLENENIDGGGY